MPVADLWLSHGPGNGRDTYWVESNGLDLAFAEIVTLHM
jgi:hypothetical protein